MPGRPQDWEKSNRQRRAWAYAEGERLPRATYRMPAKFETVCRLCKRRVAVGEWIVFKPGRAAQHERCPRPPSGRLGLIRERARVVMGGGG